MFQLSNTVVDRVISSRPWHSEPVTHCKPLFWLTRELINRMQIFSFDFKSSLEIPMIRAKKQYDICIRIRILDGIDHLDGIAFVIQSSLPRFTRTQKSIFDFILFIFGNNISSNTFMMSSFSSSSSSTTQLSLLNHMNKASAKYF